VQLLLFTDFLEVFYSNVNKQQAKNTKPEAANFGQVLRVLPRIDIT